MGEIRLVWKMAGNLARLTTVGAVTLLVLVSKPHTLFAETSVEKIRKLTETVRYVCSRVSEKGFAITAEGKLSAAAKTSILRKFFGIESDFEGKSQLQAWNGIQQVLREQQLDDNRGYRNCVQTLLPPMLQLESELTQSAERSELREGSPVRRIPVTQNGYEVFCFGLESRYPLKIERGDCVVDDSSTFVSVFERVSADVVVYRSYTGSKINCYVGNACSFGWPGSPVFGFTYYDNGTYLLLREG